MNWLVLATQAPHHGEEEAALEAGSWLDFLHRLPGWPEWLPVVEVWALVALVFVMVLGPGEFNLIIALEIGRAHV